MLRRTFLVMVGACALPVSSAQAATFYAAPNGAETGDCSISAPCTLERVTSVGNAPGSELVIGSGQYGTPAAPVPPIGIAPDVDARGEPGAPAPRFFITTSDPNVGTSVSLRAGATLRDVEIIATQGLAALRVAAGGHAERVRVNATDGALACLVDGDGARLTAVACASAADSDGISVGPGRKDARLVHVTASGVRGLVVRTDATATAVNSVFAGTAQDVELQTNATLAATSSAFATRSGTGVITETGTLTAEPRFLDGPAGDLRQALDSPTIDAGVAQAEAGSADVEGEPRRIGKAPDMGADEATLAPVVTTGAVGGLTTTSATVALTIDPGFLTTQTRLEWGPTDAAANQTPGADVAPVVDPVTGAITLTGLAPGTVYFVRAAATNDRGTGRGAVTTFRTPDVPPPPGASGPPPARPPLQPSGPPPPQVVTVPRVTIGGPTAVRLGASRRVTVTVRNRNAFELRGTATLRLGSRTLARRGGVRLRPNRTTRVTLTLSQAAVRRLGSKARRTVLALSLRRTGGAPVTVRRTLTLRR